MSPAHGQDVGNIITICWPGDLEVLEDAEMCCGLDADVEQFSRAIECLVGNKFEQ